MWHQHMLVPLGIVTHLAVLRSVAVAAKFPIDFALD